MTCSHPIAVVEPEKLPDLAAGWWDLWRAVPGATPFQSPAWLLPWIATHAPGRCRAAVLWAGGELVALLPAFCWQEALLLAGTGPSDHADILLRPGREESAAALLAALAEAWPKIDRMDLQQLPAGSPLLCCAPPPGWASAAESGEPCPLLPLSGPDGMHAVSRRMRANWRYAVRRLEREGGEIDLVPLRKAAEAAEELERLHGLRWAERGESGALAQPLMATFLRSAIPALAEAGLLRMHRLRIGRRTAGILFAMHHRSRTFYYLSGFDPAFERLSPGTILVGNAIRHAAGEGAEAFDFLRGREAYKYGWGAADRPTHRRILTRRD